VNNLALEIESIISRLQPIRLEVLQAAQDFKEELDYVYSGNLQGARNLVHYLSLRRHDIRELQEDLGRLALSSLGRLESHVIATLDALMALLHKIEGKNWDGRAIEETFARQARRARRGRGGLSARTDRLLTLGSLQ
jgi:pyruvate kinase